MASNLYWAYLMTQTPAPVVLNSTGSFCPSLSGWRYQLNTYHADDARAISRTPSLITLLPSATHRALRCCRRRDENAHVPTGRATRQQPTSSPHATKRSTATDRSVALAVPSVTRPCGISNEKARIKIRYYCTFLVLLGEAIVKKYSIKSKWRYCGVCNAMM